MCEIGLQRKVFLQGSAGDAYASAHPNGGNYTLCNELIRFRTRYAKHCGQFHHGKHGRKTLERNERRRFVAHDGHPSWQICAQRKEDELARWFTRIPPVQQVTAQNRQVCTVTSRPSVQRTARWKRHTSFLERIRVQPVHSGRGLCGSNHLHHDVSPAVERRGNNTLY